MAGSYHAHHAPFGAFATFTLGLHHARGGFGHALSAPANQNVYVGYRKGNGPWQLLPFFEPPRSQAADYLGEQTVEPGHGAYRILGESEFTRHLGWATDTWSTGPLRFSLITPFEHVPDPERVSMVEDRFYLVPAILALLHATNDSEEKLELVFGVGNPAGPWRPLADSDERLAGFAFGTEYGFAVEPQPNVRLSQGMDPLEPPFKDHAGLHRLGHEAAIFVTVEPGQTAEIPIALGFYHHGPATTGISTHYFYTQCFLDLESVLKFALDHDQVLIGFAADRDEELRESGLSPDRQWLLAHATHSYFGCTQFLVRDQDRRAIWVVHEGEYRMMNTFDLTVDHLFFELRYHPWAVREVLDLFVERYSYSDTIHTPDGKQAEGGVSFTHDMGVNNQFSPAHFSSYECAGLTGCFSHMTTEELLNWVLCAVTYAQKTDHWPWLEGKRPILEACLESILRRDDPDPAARNGLFGWDSDRCGPRGAEITTYDSLDESLGQTRNNLYMAMKAFGAYILLGHAFHRLKDAPRAAACDEAAKRIAATLVGKFDAESGTFAAVFEGGNQSRIIPAVEGLAYPLYLGMEELLAADGPYAELIDKLGTHLSNILKPGTCLDAESGGWKLSSTSFNTWFSKIALCQFVADKLFADRLPEPAKAAADRAHVGWLTSPGCAPMAMCDQIHSSTGLGMGSRYYPRGVTTILWLS